MLVKLLHSLKTASSKLVKLAGRTMLVRLLQPSKAALYILVTLFGMVILVRLIHLSNALLHMLVIPSSIITFLISLEYLFQGLST